MPIHLLHRQHSKGPRWNINHTISWQLNLRAYRHSRRILVRTAIASAIRTIDLIVQADDEYDNQ